MLALGSKTQATNTGEKDHFVKIIARHVLLDSSIPFGGADKWFAYIGGVRQNKRKPKEFAKCLCRSDKLLTAAMVDALFRIEYAEPSSNRYVAQQRAIVYWRDYLQDCEGKLPYNNYSKLLPMLQYT